ncbi:MAG: hypothetical protein IJ532_04160 [Alphaproteobacteria bacterium]|nr:hypothetical protein [Alphaproteobacteria bacterium]
MKKIFSVLACLCVAACTATHQGSQSLNVEGLSLRAKPLEVSIIPGGKIQGSARCKNFFGIPISTPSKQAFNVKLETDKGNFASDKCTRGAIYDAIVSSNADIILSPQYTTSGTGFLCMPWGCLFSDITVTVTGYKGTYYYKNGSAPVYETPAYPVPAAMTYEVQTINTVEAPIAASEEPVTDPKEIPIYVIE